MTSTEQMVSMITSPYSFTLLRVPELANHWLTWLLNLQNIFVEQNKHEGINIVGIRNKHYIF